MKKLILFLLTAFALSVSVRAEQMPNVSAHAALLMESESGDILFAKNADEPMLIASTTKILTALLVLENCGLDELVTIEPSWAAVEGSSMYLEAGESYRVEELLYGLMLASGNDAAVALACHAAGSVEAFAALMNDKAAAIGCRNAHFVNPNGLDDDAHYASASDLALITREALKNEQFCAIVSRKNATVGGQSYQNHNKLLSMYEGVFGVKTGYTKAAGRSLVSCCERGGMTLVCVTLSAPDDWQDHMSLYDWGYEHYERRGLSKPVSLPVPLIGGYEETAALVPAQELSFCCPRGAEPTLRYELPRFVFAGQNACAPQGELVVELSGKELARCALVLEENYPCAEQELSRWERILRVMALLGRKVYSF